jgi:hypothetical protein|tara:strand:- start:819 stop:1139 length:321 start_codon:yes stop_codon:yes gene_type:complete
MTIENHGTTAVITQDKTSLIEFSKKFFVLYERFKSEDVIIHLIDTSVGSIEDFSSLVRKHTSAKRCFVIVNVDLNQEDFENLIIIPTLQEAHDFIEMEVMQRDLGL